MPVHTVAPWLGSDRPLILKPTVDLYSCTAVTDLRSTQQLWYPDACKSERPDHRFSGQTSRLACVPFFTPIDSEFNGHMRMP